ncbi:GntR family transcriptional regulator [Rhizobium leguminosarum]|uniref:GntR family transcriptional regulator n=1 Tax=Rhizobium leguminosarum TaxID=384 RepID=UPI003F94E80D
MTGARPGNIPPLDPAAATPFYRQIYDRFRGAIASGVLKPGDRIPSARALTKELGLARGTIEAAYSLLAAEGYIQARGQAGTIVTPDLKPQMPVSKPILSAESSGIVPTSFRPDSSLPFQMGLPALDTFPRKIWARLGARCVRAMQPADMVHPAVSGLPALAPRSPHTCRSRAASVVRRLRCSSPQVIATPSR